MEMNDKIQLLLNTLVRPGVEYNIQQMAFAGVGFFKNQDGKVSGLVPSPYFVIEVEDMGIQPQADFFHYITNQWGPYPYPVPVSLIMERLKTPKMIGSVTFPFMSLVNHLNKMDDKFKKKCRLILTPNQLFQSDLVIKFVDENGRKVFRHPALNKPCVIADNSAVPTALVTLNTLYKGAITGETDDSYIVNVISLYSKVQMGIHYSEKGFFPDNMEIVNRMVNIPYNFILGTNTVTPAQNFVMPPVHLDCSLFYDVCRIFTLANATFLELHFGENPNSPVVLRNIKNNPNDMQINILLGTLNPYYGVQRR